MQTRGRLGNADAWEVGKCRCTGSWEMQTHGPIAFPWFGSQDLGTDPVVHHDTPEHTREHTLFARSEKVCARPPGQQNCHMTPV